jgi:hypothetical protein
MINTHFYYDIATTEIAVGPKLNYFNSGPTEHTYLTEQPANHQLASVSYR